MRGQVEAQAISRGMSTDQVIAQFRAMQPGNRFLDVGEVAAAVGFLASPLSAGINGVCLPIDLGASA